MSNELPPDDVELFDQAFSQPNESTLVDVESSSQRLVELREALFSAVSLSPNSASQVVAPSLGERLTQSIATLERYAPLADAIANVLDTSRSQARRLLHQIDDVDPWQPGWVPGSKYIPVTCSGPALANAQVILARLGPGAYVPRHRHVGEERTFVIDGELRDDDGRYGSGQFFVNAVDSVHDLVVSSSDDCIAIIINLGPLELVQPDHGHLIRF